jgi:hypothetical protein
MQSIVTIAAVLAAGIRLIWRGESGAHANISHAVTVVGDVPALLCSAKTCIQRVLPLDPLVSTTITKGESPFDVETGMIEWPMIGSSYRRLSW